MRRRKKSEPGTWLDSDDVQHGAGERKEPGWAPHPKREHTWIAPGDVYVDVIPAGAEGAETPVLIWPQSGFEMNLAGLRLAFEEAVTIEPAPGLTLRVAPLEVLALLKMVAYLDRPHGRDRDLSDIAHILDDYAIDMDDLRYGEEILDLGLSHDEVSPYLLGKRLAEIVKKPERDAVISFISLVKDVRDATATQARMLVAAPSSWRRDPEELMLRIEAFERGFGGAPLSAG